MSVVLHCGFKAIENVEAHFRPSTLEKGRQLYDNNHVYRVREVNGTDISAKCLSQQSKQAYDVELQLSIAPRTVLKGTCTCRYGALGDCKHCAAVVFYIKLHEDVSCTSGPQSWGKPSSKPDHDDKVPLRKLFGDNNSPFVANKQPAELPPTYITQHFGGIESPFTTVLKEMEKSEAEIRRGEILHQIFEKDRRALLHQKLNILLKSPHRPLHMLGVLGDFPKVTIAPRNHLQGLTPEERAFYNNFVVCESVNELCVLTAGQSSCPR
ncbi:uncharacterized protein LOC142592791 [Dermacentor variabilis]|uniref:uncharacterized protein LOC142592791 n=1 Tax=Dermacentor variabilis TaxID=34621 RepID=UPI003F5C3759